MSDSEKGPKPFWTTLPGILTGIAGLITAICGGLLILFQIYKLMSPTPTPTPVTSQAPYETNVEIATIMNTSEYLIHPSETIPPVPPTNPPLTSTQPPPPTNPPPTNTQPPLPTNPLPTNPPPTNPPPTQPPPPSPTSEMENLLAYYTLNGTSQDAKSSYSQIDIGNGTFSGDAIYCDGIAYTCIQTPPLYNLNYQNFSISADFKVSEYPQSQYPIPVFVGGELYRWIGVNIYGNGHVGLLYNNFGSLECLGSYNLNTWHNALITYDGSIGRLYLDNQPICTVAFAINTGGGDQDKNVSSSNFSNATAFKGLIRRLKIYRLAVTP